jgi:hypothetical protein
VAEERAFHLLRLAEAASATQPMLARLWAEEVFQLSFDLPPTNRNRLPIQKNALVMLAKLDPNHAVNLFESMDTPVPEQPDGSLGEDVRADAATTVFPEFWNRRGLLGIDKLRTLAHHLGETGQYPYLGIAPIVRQLAEKDPAIAETLFNEALSYYRRGARVDAADYDFVDFLKDLWNVVPRPLARMALETVVSTLVKRREAEEESFRARVYTDKGTVDFQSPVDQLLFQVLPLVKETDPDWARRLIESRPELKQARHVEGMTNRVEGVVIRGSVNPAEVASLQQRGLEGARLRHIESIALERPEEAMRLSASLADPALRSVAFASVAAGLSPTAPDQAKRLLEEVSQAIPGIGDEKGKLRALTALAQAAAGIGNMDSFRQALRKGFDLGVELFQQDLDVHPTKPAMFAAGFHDLTQLTRVGVRFDPQYTLGQVSSLQNALLQAYLLVDAAEGLRDSREVK